MATTWADLDHKDRQPTFVRGLSVINRIKGNAHKHKEKIPLIKLGLMILGLIIAMFLYVIYVTEASTSGYFYKEETQKLNRIKATYNLTKLDVLEHKKRLRNNSNDFSAWSDPNALRSRLIIIDPQPQEDTSSE